MVAILGVEFDTFCKIYQYLCYVTWYLYLTFFKGTCSWHMIQCPSLPSVFWKLFCFNKKKKKKKKKKMQILIEDHTI